MIPYWPLSAYYFFYFGFVGAFSPYFTLYFQSLGLGATDIAILMSVMQFMRIVAPSLWGWLADRMGRRVAIIQLSALASLAGYALFFFTARFEGLFVAMALMAFFWSAALPLAESLTFSHLGTTHKAVYGKIRVWGSVGFIAAVLGIGHLLDWLGIDAVLWLTALVLAGILGCSLGLREAVRGVQGGHQPGFWSVLRQREVLALLGACFLMSAAHGALYVFYSIHLVEHGYHKAVVGWMWTLGVVAEIGVFLLMPRLQRRFGLRCLLLAAFACAVLRFLLIGWAAALPAAMGFAQLLHGMTFGAYHAAAIAAINHWFAGSLQSRGQALYGSLSFGAGGMLGALVSGAGWERLGAGWTFTGSAGFALLGWLVVWRGMRRELRTD